MPTWRDSRPIAWIIIGTFLVVQLAIPVSRSGEESARRFGWQMFSESAQTPDFVVINSDGDAIEVELADYTAILRGDIDLIARLPAHLCSVIADAETITWQTGSYAC